MLMILVYFPSGGCVDGVVNNRTNHQFISVIVVHFMNSARVCWNIRRTVFNVYVCLNQLEIWTQPIWMQWWKTKTWKAVFSKFRQFLYLNAFRKWCVCVFISAHRKGVSWLNRTMDVLPDIQASDVVLRKLLYVKNLRLHVIVNHSRDLLASNCARVSIKPGKAARSKRQLLKLSKTNGKSAKHSYLPPH